MRIKIRLLILFFCCVCTNSLLAQKYQQSAESVALGNTSFSGGLCVFSSKSCFSSTSAEIRLHHSNQFITSELNSFSLDCRLPIPSLITSIGISTFGYQHYRENKFSLALSKRLGQKVALGVITQLHTLQYTDCSEHYKKIIVGLDASFNIHNNDFIYTKFQHCFLLNNFSNIINTERNLFFIGIQSHASLSSSWILEVKTVDFQRPSIHLGFEYLVKHFAFRVGGYGLPIRPTYGLGFSKGRWTINVAADWLINVGHSLCCDIQFKIGKITNNKF